MSKNVLRNALDKFNLKINELDACGRKWIGYDGLLNMETFALVTLFFMIFLQIHWAAIISLGFSFLKGYIDYKKGRLNEKHDLICSAIGIIFGCIIGIAITI